VGARDDSADRYGHDITSSMPVPAQGRVRSNEEPPSAQGLARQRGSGELPERLGPRVRIEGAPSRWAGVEVREVAHFIDHEDPSDG
jgi:hypothetical protein